LDASCIILVNVMKRVIAGSLCVLLLLGGLHLLGLQIPARYVPAPLRTCDPFGDPFVRASGSALEVCGIVTGRSVNEIIDRDLSRIRQISITSAGGDGVAASVLLSYLNGHSIELVVKGMCASACLNLAVGAVHVRLTNASALLAHSDLRGRLTMMQSVARDAGYEGEPAFEDVLESSFQLLESLDEGGSGAANRYAAELVAPLHPHCAGWVHNGGLMLAFADGSPAFQAEYAFWGPSRETLDRWRAARGLPRASGEYEVSAVRDRLRSSGREPGRIRYPSDDEVQSETQAYNRQLEGTAFRFCAD
jgi:hypothetical protein